MSWTQEKAQETLLQVQKKAESDAAFREKLKTNPNAAIEEIAGIQVPAGFKINVVDANDADLTIALPKTKSDELSDNDLESVAGGKSVTDTLINIASCGVYQLAADNDPNNSSGTSTEELGIVYDAITS